MAVQVVLGPQPPNHARIPDRDVLSTIFFVLRTGRQCKALDDICLYNSSTAHSMFQHWVQAGVFARLWDEALSDDDDSIGLDFSWLALDGSLHKAPLGGKKQAPTPRTAPKAALSAAC